MLFLAVEILKKKFQQKEIFNISCKKILKRKFEKQTKKKETNKPKMNNTLYLQKLANKHGDFRIAIAQKTPQGMRWSKHYTVLQCWEMGQKGQWILQHANNRQILPNEMIADLDAENATLTNMNNLCNYLEQNQIHYTAYFTGSKGYHIHTLNKTELTKKTKEYFLNRFKCDMAKANATALIALEGSPHWKTGALKTEIRHYGMTTQRIHRPEEND